LERFFFFLKVGRFAWFFATDAGLLPFASFSASHFDPSVSLRAGVAMYDVVASLGGFQDF